MSDELLPCPFCGGKAHLRRKIKYRQNTENPTATVEDFYPGGEVENEVQVLDWAFGFQAWCGRCHAKMPYEWGEWHSYDDDELEMLDREDFYRHMPDESDEDTKEKAAKTWNRRDRCGERVVER